MMDTTNVILKIKVKASQVKHFPFDVVYIVVQELKALLPQMFPYSLCLPFNDDLLQRFRAVRFHAQGAINTTERHSNVFAQTWHDGQPIEQFLELDRIKQSFLVIPVLPRAHQVTRNQKRKDRNPAYLIANQHRAGEHEDKRGKKTNIQRDKDMIDFMAFFNDFAVMFTPRGPLRPICRACPHHLEHVQGKCTLGEQKCYQALIIQPERRRNGEQLQANRADNDPGTA